MLTRVFESLGRLVARHPRLTVLVWAVVAAGCFAVALVGVGGQNLFDRLSTGEPVVPGSDSARASELLAETSTSGASLSLVVQGVDPATEGLAEALAPAREEVAAVDGVVSVIDPFVLPDGPANPAAAPLLAQDGDGFLLVAELDPELSDDAESAALRDLQVRLEAVPDALHDVAPDATGLVGGTSLIVSAITDQVEQDLTTGEAIALPVALLIMVLVFGGFLAAAMPLAGAIASIAGGLGSLVALSYVMDDLESSVVNVVTVLGLGLSIDYGLLIVSRFREELGRTLGDDEGRSARRRRGDGAVVGALLTTMSTAGRTVAFSALTVAISIAGLLVFRQDILRAFGAGSVAVIVFAVATALTLVPALLVLAGRRLARPSVLSRVPGVRAVLARTADVDHEEGVFSRLAARVQRRPWWVMGGSLAVLLVLAIPLLHLELRNSTTELLPGPARSASTSRCSPSSTRRPRPPRCPWSRGPPSRTPRPRCRSSRRWTAWPRSTPRSPAARSSSSACDPSRPTPAAPTPRPWCTSCGTSTCRSTRGSAGRRPTRSTSPRRWSTAPRGRSASSPSPPSCCCSS